MSTAMEVARVFALEGEPIDAKPYGCGHINDTYCVCCQREGKPQRRYILQRINHNVFKDVPGLMRNMIAVTAFLRQAVIAEGGNPDRECLTLIDTRDGEKYYHDPDGNYWRAFIFIENAITYQTVEKPEHFYYSGCAFGKFQRLLAKGELPLRVTHNDTKLNNVMLDDVTGRPVCVIDLDTVMPGLSLYDYGDSMRFGTNPAAEDETDLSKVTCDLNLFEQYTKGFLEECGSMLTPQEIENLPLSAKLMTLECGMRFLADHIAGDTYFKIHREGHNLDRCRTQLKLVADMEAKMDTMKQIVEKYR